MLSNKIWVKSKSEYTLEHNFIVWMSLIVLSLEDNEHRYYINSLSNHHFLPCSSAVYILVPGCALQRRPRSYLFLRFALYCYCLQCMFPHYVLHRYCLPYVLFSIQQTCFKFCFHINTQNIAAANATLLYPKNCTQDLPYKCKALIEF